MNKEPLFFKIDPGDLEKRLTVESYLPEILFVKKQLRKGLSLDQIASITSGSTPKDKTAFKGGTILYLKTQHVHEGDLNLDEKFYITEDAHNTKLRKSKVFPGDILFTIIGASPKIIGRAVIFPHYLKEANINQNIARIRVFNENYIKPKYIEAFLNSPLGRAQSEMLSRVAAQYNLNLSEVRSIRIPIPRPEVQEKIASLWEQATIKIKNIEEEIEILLKVINGDIVFSNFNINIPRPPDTLFFQIEGGKLERKLKVEYYRSKNIQDVLETKKDELNLQKIENIVRFKEDLIEPQNYPDRFFKLLYVSFDGKTRLREERLGRDIRYKHMKRVKKDDVLVSRINAIRGAISIVPHSLDKGLVSNEHHVLTYDSEKITNIYLWKILRSSWIREILEGYTTGGSKLRISENRLKELKIPVPSLSLQIPLSSYIVQTQEKLEKLYEKKNSIMVNTKLSIQNNIIEVLQREDYNVFKNVVLDMAMSVIDKHKDVLKELAKY